MAVAVPIPTEADNAAEQYGLRTELLGGTSGETYGSPSAADIFIHGRDYYCPQPKSTHFSVAPDQGQFVRTYRLWPDNTFTSNTWTGRKKFVSAARLKRFIISLLGYPYTQSVGSPAATTLRRHLPEPYYAGVKAGAVLDGDSFAYEDTRTGSVIERYELHATRILSIQGIAPHGQNPESPTRDGTHVGLWTPKTQSDIWQASAAGTFSFPDEAYGEYEIAVLFERTPYLVSFRSGANAAAYEGEYSRFMLPQEEPVGRALQVRAGVTWDDDTGHYGQPGSGDIVPATEFAQREGAPKLVGENMLTWKWLDVPGGAYDWGKIQRTFGKINNATFPTDAAKAPFQTYVKEGLLLRSAGRIQKPSVAGQPLWDLTFYFQYSPAEDGFGAWNRLLNTKGFYQRYTLKDGSDFYKSEDFTKLFKPPDAW